MLYLAATGPEPLGITRVGVAVDDFTTDGALSTAQSLGIRHVQDVMGPLTARVLPGESSELLIGDPDGLILHLQDGRSCGARAALGRTCADVAPAVPALLTLRGLNHFTLNVSDAERSRTFYRSLLGLVVKLYQGPVPMLGFQDGSEFIGMAGATANGATPGVPNIAHVCFLVQDFEPGRVTTQLARMGIKSGPNPAGPLSSYVSLRMADRNGAPEGTPELYFLDPDGNYIQLQNASYCGGAGYLGDRCTSPPQ
jgi:catechol 2,3-dioxygenase-like lactoylglutathione lyase family enzyme